MLFSPNTNRTQHNVVLQANLWANTSVMYKYTQTYVYIHTNYSEIKKDLPVSHDVRSVLRLRPVHEEGSVLVLFPQNLLCLRQ